MSVFGFGLAVGGFTVSGEPCILWFRLGVFVRGLGFAQVGRVMTL